MQVFISKQRESKLGTTSDDPRWSTFEQGLEALLLVCDVILVNLATVEQH